MGASFIDVDVLSYKNSSVVHSEIEKLCAKNNISSTGNKEDVILEVFGEGEVICLFRLKGVNEELFYFYLGVLDEIKMHFPFIDFVAILLTTLNIAPCPVMFKWLGFYKSF